MLRGSVVFVTRLVLFFGYWVLLMAPNGASSRALGADLAVGLVAAAGALLLSPR